jgi:hypothetical protein
MDRSPSGHPSPITGELHYGTYDRLGRVGTGAFRRYRPVAGKPLDRLLVQHLGRQRSRQRYASVAKPASMLAGVSAVIHQVKMWSPAWVAAQCAARLLLQQATMSVPSGRSGGTSSHASPMSTRSYPPSRSSRPATAERRSSTRSTAHREDLGSPVVADQSVPLSAADRLSYPTDS